ncbi:hypothetical protein [Mycobacterium branderi]|uniref:Uncharacterized protein n=1 Tax=Mycobacterium branderi TaxID=43348 RepID=A0A7I7VYP2_9MYCO|nr:hypothetical protein [Mycobacterium branderi]MCV7232750.1 hypothetical protein [Mycobacterium branderi]ORA40889.1 hypothetical protein BST20_01705 [Mycobacterium branderi]BBZ09847.1 hypothetical protein MBRA_00420 [Mycobacterium branderi]
MKYKLGLKPVHTHPRVRLCDYYTSDLPSVDSLKFPLGHAGLIEPHMFMNDQLGDCAIAGSIEEIRLANALRGVTVNFTDDTAVQNYSEITGYSPADPGSDQGTDVHELYEFRQNTGIVDADGNRHKIVAYAGLTPGDWDEMLIALSLFEMVGIGVQVPDYAEAQFEAGLPWHLIAGRHSIEGGHYIPIWGASDRHTAQLPTWGAEGGITSPFYSTLNTVAVVALTEEMFTGGKSPAGVDFNKLARDLAQLNTGPVLTPAPRRRSRKDADDPAPEPAA